jgi:hypothetical protein
MGAYSRRRDEVDAMPSSKSGNAEDVPIPPQPLGLMGVTADLVVARRRRWQGIDFLLPPRYRP